MYPTSVQNWLAGLGGIDAVLTGDCVVVEYVASVRDVRATVWATEAGSEVSVQCRLRDAWLIATTD